MASRRRVGISVAVGLLHAAVLLLVALDLGYSIGPAEYTLVGALWRYGGLVVVAALPVWLTLRYHLVVPVLALALTTGYVLGMELTPGPTFRDVAELERLDEPTGITVVSDGLYIVRYMLNASVWSVGFLFTGLVEYAMRTRCERVPSVREPPAWLSIPLGQRRALVLAAVGGALHMVVMVWFAHRLGITASGTAGWYVYGFSAFGMFVLAAVPLYLLLRRELVLPIGLLTMAVLFDVQADFTAGVEDPHDLYFAGWFVLLGVLVVFAGVEYGLRRVWRTRRVASS